MRVPPLRRRGGLVLWTMASIVLWLCAVIPRAQQPQAIFRSGVDIVQLDVAVLDKDRRPIRGLAAEDFTILEDGEPRPVAAFSAVDLTAPPPAASAPRASWVRDVAPDVASNTASAEGRLVVILFDRSIPQGRPTLEARRIAHATVDALAPGDLAAIVTNHIGVPQNFTVDRARLGRAIDAIDLNANSSAQDRELFEGAGGGLGTFSPLWDGRCMCGVCVLDGVTALAHGLQRVPARRKVVFFIGSAVTFQVPPDTIGCDVRLKDARERMFAALDRAHVTVHSIDPTGLENVGQVGQAASLARAGASRGNLRRDIQERLEQQGALSVLPDRTGGRAIANTNAPELSVPDLVRESGAYYLLGFTPAGDGKSHSITVKVNRRGADVFTVRQYDARPAPAAAADTPLSDALTGTLPAGPLPLQLALAPFSTGGGRGALTVAVGVPLSLRDGRPFVAASRPLTVVARAFDRRGRAVGSAQQRLLLAPQESNSRGTVNVLSRLDLEPGDYEIRVAVEGDDPAMTSSVGTYAVVPDFSSDPLTLSGIVLATDPESPAIPSDFLAALLPVRPIVRRTFASTEALTAFVRVYQGVARTSAAFDVNVGIQVRDTQDKVRVGKTLVLKADRFDGLRAADVAIDVPLPQLTAGEYLLQVNAEADHRVAGRAVRFSVR